MWKKSKIENHVLLVALMFGVMAWVADAVLDYAIFYEGSFWNLLIMDVPHHEIYIRFFILTSFIIFGLIVSKIFKNQRKLQEELYASERHLSRIEKELGNTYIFFSRTIDGHFLHASSGAKTLLGLEESDVIGKHWTEILPWLPETLESSKEVARLFESGELQTSTNEMCLTGKDGEDRYLRVDQYAVDCGDSERKVEGIVQDVTQSKKEKEEREALILELGIALSEVKQLSGLLPICSYCKKIRDDKGSWTQLESYIHKHSEAEFSHGICEDCASIHYPDLKINED